MKRVILLALVVLLLVLLLSSEKSNYSDNKKIAINQSLQGVHSEMCLHAIEYCKNRNIEFQVFDSGQQTWKNFMEKKYDIKIKDPKELNGEEFTHVINLTNGSPVNNNGTKLISIEHCIDGKGYPDEITIHPTKNGTDWFLPLYSLYPISETKWEGNNIACLGDGGSFYSTDLVSKLKDVTFHVVLHNDDSEWRKVAIETAKSLQNSQVHVGIDLIELAEVLKKCNYFLFINGGFNKDAPKYKNECFPALIQIAWGCGASIITTTELINAWPDILSDEINIDTITELPTVDPEVNYAKYQKFSKMRDDMYDKFTE